MAVDEAGRKQREIEGMPENGKARGGNGKMNGWKSVARRLAGMAAALCLMIPAGGGKADTGLEFFRVRNGDRESRRIAITMDDAFEREWVWKTVELCKKYGITMTFFPIGVNLLEEEREGWQALLDAGCEIGCHTSWHEDLGGQSRQETVYSLLFFQETLDRVLGKHYELRWIRPPYGNLADAEGSEGAAVGNLRKVGYGHAILWDVSWVIHPDTGKPDPEGAFRRTKNGSILLFHAREADYTVLETLIPMLLEAGFEPVTVSEMFGYDLPEAGGEPFVYDPKTYRYPETMKD